MNWPGACVLPRPDSSTDLKDALIKLSLDENRVDEIVVVGCLRDYPCNVNLFSLVIGMVTEVFTSAEVHWLALAGGTSAGDTGRRRSLAEVFGEEPRHLSGTDVTLVEESVCA